MSTAYPILDVCCGSRMFWFDKNNRTALFTDKRAGTYISDSRQGRRAIVVSPDILADFKALPFRDNSFPLVVFDPPHTFSGPNGWNSKKYGSLCTGWKEEIRQGFAECFRVLVPFGTLVFKWNEHRVTVATILSLTPEKPLFGQRIGATAKGHWIVFMKERSTKMSKRCSDEERIVTYFENAVPAAAQATLNICKAILKRRQGQPVVVASPAPIKRRKRRSKAEIVAAELAQVKAGD